MKRGFFLGILTLSILLISCKDKTITTQYSVGCISYSDLSSQSQWSDLENYLVSRVVYNKLVSFEGKNLSETDEKAKEMFKAQMAKIDTGMVCSYIANPDFFVYGVRALRANGGYRVVKAAKISSDGIENYTE